MEMTVPSIYVLYTVREQNVIDVNQVIINYQFVINLICNCLLILTIFYIVYSFR